jgi:WD40 repeat protein
MPHRHYSFGDRGYFAVSSDNAVSVLRVRRPVSLRRSADLSSLFGNYIKVRMSNYATDRIVAIDRGLATLRDGRVMLVRNTSKLPSYIRGVAISRIDHHAIVVADLEGRISAWDISSVEWPKVMFAFHTRSPAPEVGTFSNDRIHYACPATRGRVQIWDIGTGMPVTVAEDFGTVSALQFSPSGSTLAIGGERGRIYLWKLDSQEMVSMADSVGDAPIGKVAFSPDGSHLAGANDEYLGIWNIVSNSLDYRAPARGIKDIVFSRDGEKVAASVKESVIVWDMATRHMAVGTLPVAPSVIAFDDHGRHLITYEAGIVVYWPMPEVAVPLLCQQIRDAHRYREVADICDPLLAAAAAKTP